MKKRTLAMMMAALMLSTALTGCKGNPAGSEVGTGLPVRLQKPELRRILWYVPSWKI